MQAFGNVLLSLASLVYLVPLQVLLFDYARKKDDGGGAIAGILILGVLWLLLLASLMLATAQGGFDWLPLRRGVVYPIVAAATLSLGVVTFISLVSTHRPTVHERLFLSWIVYVAPVITIMLVVWMLNPALQARIPATWVRVPWVMVAGLSLLGCSGYVSYSVVRSLGRQATGLVHAFSGDRELAQRNLARIPTLDPERDFDDLLGLASTFNPRDVRELAIARLRTDPRFLDTLTDALERGTPSKPLALIECAEFSVEERRRLAPAASRAMLRYAEGARADLRYVPESRRKLAHRWGAHLLREVGRKFADAGLDAAPALAVFERAFQTELEREEAG